MNFPGKVILITGASSGIGKEVAIQLSEEKCSLALLARRGDLLIELVEQLSNSAAEVEIFKCDVTDLGEVRQVVSQIKNRFGDIDIAILNAGVGHRLGAKEYSAASSKKVFDTNVLGITNFVENILPDYIKRRSGMIVGITSLSDSRGWPGSGFYSASKIAATRLLESLRIDVKQYNIKVITVKPGFIRTAMTAKNDFPMPFLMDADKAAKIILKGIKKEKRIVQFPFLTALGSRVIGLMPDFLFEYYASKWSVKYLN